MTNDIDPEGASFYAGVVHNEGWIPLICICMEYGTGNYSHHLYAFRGEEQEEQFGCFRYSNNHALIKDRITIFPSPEKANEDFKSISEMVRFAHIPHQLLHLK